MPKITTIAKPIKYSSAKTRTFSLDIFLGGAQGDEINKGPLALPIDNPENLEAKFKSGANRTDIPRMWGHPEITRKIGDKTMSLANEISAWRRNKGEPVK